LNTPTVISDTGEREAIERADVSIQVRRFGYETGRGNALEDVHVDVGAGRILGIVGPIGAGKTTLLRLLLRLYEDPEASIRIGGVPVQEFKVDALRRHVAVVPQEAFLFSTTVADNIALGRPEATEQEIRNAARLACIADDIERFPDGYRTMVGERGITLSGGQKQRMAIARALLLDAPILVLDDALSAVDVTTERAILRALREARKTRTTLIVSHRLSAVADADEVIVLSHGRIIERGAPEQLLARDGWYAQMHRYQQLERSMESVA
jgi:ABC-type multidrug transport system fused ATPase/permease subunit